MPSDNLLAGEMLTVSRTRHVDVEWLPTGRTLVRVVTARAIAFHHGDRTCLVLYQAESSECDKMDQVFQAVTLSLLRSDL